MLRECLKHEVLCRKFIFSDDLYKLFKFLDVNAFEITSDAFMTLKVCAKTKINIFLQETLFRHKTLTAEFLEKNFDKFFGDYNTILLGSKQYVTKRQSLKV